MAYVPGFTSDIFLSYAHADDVDWVRAFEKSLTEGISRRLGSPVAFWKDDKEIRLGENWADEIAAGIQQSAVFVAVVSPSYRNSPWCQRERQTFIAQVAAHEEFATSGRFLKVIKTPWEENQHEEFLAELQHVSFFRRDDPRSPEVEFLAGSEEFRLAMSTTTAAVAHVLRMLRRKRERVFVASPAPDCHERWRDLYREFHSHSYDVQPEAPRDRSFTDEYVRKEMQGAKLSVHLLGGTYDDFSVRQVRLAADLEQRLVVLLSSPPEGVSDARQRALLASLRDGRTGEGDALPSGWTLLVEKSSRRAIQEVLAMLKPTGSEQPAPANPGGRTSIYLLCDPTTDEDAAFAADLKQQLANRENLEVLLPTGAHSSGEFQAQHLALLQRCDGVLLYQGAAPEPWLLQTVPQVLFAEKLVNRAPIRSKGLLLSTDPTPFAAYPNLKVIARTPQFGVADLEPFLQPLRSSSVGRANV